jgi:hypothetical protein
MAHSRRFTRPPIGALGEIYGWFTEGFDTVDLREAQTLLEELKSGPDSTLTRRG